jgi:hypothetical protein
VTIKVSPIFYGYLFFPCTCSDLVKIGGKRESLSGLSYKLKKIDGVDDGIFFIPKAVPIYHPCLFVLLR